MDRLLVISLIAAVVAGGATWFIFYGREETLIAVVLVVTFALMPFAWIRERNAGFEPRLVTYGKHLVMVAVLLWTLWFAGIAFDWY